MAACPACGRPVAVVQPRCIYCGVGLPEVIQNELNEQRRIREAAEVPVAPPPEVPRSFLLLDLRAADANTAPILCDALGMPAYDARQRAMAGGIQLHLALPPGEADAEAARLRGAGLTVHVIADSEIRSAAPVQVHGGQLEEEGLRADSEDGPVTVAAADLLLVVKGAITREFKSEPVAESVQAWRSLRQVRAASPTPGFRFHLHRTRAPRPLELDPADFDFGPWGPLSGGALPELHAWVERLSASVAVDDQFRRLIPVLSPEVPVTGRRNLPRRAGAPEVLDNLAQFRSYSAWRGVIARREGGAARR